MTQEEFDALQRRGRQYAYWHARVLRLHFFPDLPHPTFEPIRHLGVVEESTVVDGSVVVLGITNHLIIRDHPIRCIPPSGSLIVTSVVESRYVRMPSDEAVELFFRTNHGRAGLFLGSNVRSPSEVPPGTEILVDRSAARAIPPLAELLSQQN